MLANRVALITGSTSGIGLGIAHSLANAGASIVLNGFGEASEIQNIVSNIRNSYGVKCIHDSANMCSKEEIARMIETSSEKFGKIDVLVNNCGIQHVSPIEDFDDSLWEKVIGLNLNSNFYTIKHTIEGMRERKYGRIINISSVHGKVASANKSAYVASKHGVIGLTKSVALETAENEGVTCNAICPGFVMTPLVEEQIRTLAQKNMTSYDVEAKALIGEKMPSKSFVHAEDIGEMCVFLCSPSAHQLTGQSIAIDGGWTAV